MLCLVTQSCLTLLWPHVLQPARLLCLWGFSRQEYWSGCHALLQGIFPIQVLNPGLALQGDSLPSEPLLRQINKQTKSGSWSLRLFFGSPQSLQLGQGSWSLRLFFGSPQSLQLAPLSPPPSMPSPPPLYPPIPHANSLTDLISSETTSHSLLLWTCQNLPL